MSSRHSLPAVSDDDCAEPPIKNTAATRALRALLERAVRRVKSVAELSHRLDVAASHITRMRKGLVGAGVETLWDLADVLDEDPVAVLRACGQVSLADRIDQLRHGLAPRPHGRLYEKIERLSGDDRDRVLDLIVDRLLIDSRATGIVLPPIVEPTSRSER